MEWKIDPAHSYIDFKVRYLVSGISGKFTGVTGKVQTTDGSESPAPELLGFDARFEVASFNTGVPPRDHHVTGPDFLDAAAHPEAVVRMVEVRPDVPGRYLLTVELTLHGVSHQVELATATAGPATDIFGITRIGASASGWLRRSDFGVTEYLGFISDAVDFTVEVQAVPDDVPDDRLPPAR
ncbi:YceI family protein [Streptomyces sp. NPDC052309]|uniref:YceI family protein n=1 Tax=Streptomyces sp. NPDC052309 TaxID=3155421 RepID=UPI0034295CD8